jgi:hypothetical protein
LNPQQESFKELGAAIVKLTEWQKKSRVHVDETQAKIDTLLSQIEQSFELLDELFLLRSAIYTMSSNKCNNGIRTRVMHGHMLKNPVTLNQIAAIKAMREAQGILRTQTSFMKRGIS